MMGMLWISLLAVLDCDRVMFGWICWKLWTFDKFSA